ncbi:GNAT family N-acetyltransferase [Acetobacterium woodii]|uniref:Acetyltransferase GNAT family n=1 Tax=Acetobacterium woodii (strain ATCC 29683 / DSM 1030 / JCM 2381 / KCTC 1655 / WB1) TaxID=931626 RepID=H6LKP9_ACEWD|nr:GNAT family N-acetyltransferase [Acetobacterium woodii]AFA48841.1 acetyltransferase GNAT family [Acetobacterium woodii DSM 1030]
MKINYQHESEDKRVAAYWNNQEVGECAYSSNGPKCWIINHTYVKPEFRGNKIAVKLVENIVEIAKENRVKIIPLCPFAFNEFSRKEAYHEMNYVGDSKEMTD